MQSAPNLAVAITKAASKQTYYTIRFLADRERAPEAYCAYAYFRWVDDTIDGQVGSNPERNAFIRRQQKLLESCYRGEIPGELSAEEQILVELVRGDSDENSGLQAYLRNMMAVMAFDVERRGRLISQAELDKYTHNLASAVTESMHYFVGHSCFSPHDETRYLAVSAAHITHMLRDTLDDVRSGYFNIPREVLEAAHITPQDVQSDAYRDWARERAQLAGEYFKAGKAYLNQVENWRCRLAGYSYVTRFERLLNTFERDGYRIRDQYPDGLNLEAGLHIIWLLLSSLSSSRRRSDIAKSR
jgi:phytoene/squalene synthetase